MNLKALKLAFQMTTIDPFQKLVLLEIAKDCDQEGNAKISVSALADKLNSTPAKVLHALFELHHAHGAVFLHMKVNLQGMSQIFKVCDDE